MVLNVTVASPSEQPDDFNALGKEYMQAGRLDEAEQAYFQAINAAGGESETPWSVHDIGIIYLKQERFAEAEEYLNRSRELMPGEIWPYMSLATLFFTQGEDDKAAWQLQQARLTLPNRAYVDVEVANVYLEFQQFELALTYYKEALYKQPDNEQALQGLAWASEHVQAATSSFEQESLFSDPETEEKKTKQRGRPRKIV